MIRTFEELLGATGCPTRAELDRLLYGRCQLDPSILEVSDDGIVIGILDSGLALAFPFSTEEFWEAVRGFDAQVQRRVEEQARRGDG